MSEFLKNCWYVAAWSSELGDKPLGRRLLDQPVVMYRKSDGTPVAMIDRCPHRFVPLSMGTVRNDELVCGYHSLSFNTSGRCTTARACDVADRFILRTFPLAERYGAVWIWMGDPELADPVKIPHFDFFDDPDRVTVCQGTTYLGSNYMLEVDNLLDLTHVDTLHAGTIANVPMTVIGEYEARREGNSIHSDWFVSGTRAPLQYHSWIANSGLPAWQGDAKEKVDLWLDMRWDPASSIMLNTGISPHGTDRANAIEVLQGHFITPETTGSTHYFWSFSIPDYGTSEEDIAFFVELARRAFEDEDRPMLHAQQKAMEGSDFWSERPMILKEDAGAIRVRRALDKMIRDEATGSDTKARTEVEPAE